MTVWFWLQSVAHLFTHFRLSALFSTSAAFLFVSPSSWFTIFLCRTWQFLFFFFFFLQSLLTVLPGTSKSLISFEFLFSELLCLRLWTSYHHIMYALTTILLKRTRILYPRNPVGGTGHVFLFCCPFIPPFFFFSFRLSVLSCSGWGDGVWSLESIHSSCSSNGAMPCPFHVYERTNETAMR